MVEASIKSVFFRHELYGTGLTLPKAISQGTPLKAVEVEDRLQEFQEYVSVLEDGGADVGVLQKLTLICANNPIPAHSASPLSFGLGLSSTTSPFVAITRSLPPLIPDMWMKDKSFERLFDGLMRYLEPSKVCMTVYIPTRLIIIC